jgi:hypothetical protein
MRKNWECKGDRLKLNFTPFYPESKEVVAEMFKGEDGDWYYTSSLLDDEDAYLCNANICEHDAKLEMEERIYGYYEGERNGFQELMDKFSEG